MIVPKINGKYSLFKKMVCLSIFICVLSSSAAWAATTHTAILKIKNPNTSASMMPVSERTGKDDWTQVYVEIPAGLYREKKWLKEKEKKWLKEDLTNLRFIDDSSGKREEVTHWRQPTANENVNINHLGFWLLVKNLSPGTTKNIKIEMVKDGSFKANPRVPKTKYQTKEKTDDKAASSVFPFYAYGVNDPEWSWSIPHKRRPYIPFNSKCINVTLHSEDNMTKDMKSDKYAKTANEFTLSILNLKFYERPWLSYINKQNKLKIYFLSQVGGIQTNDFKKYAPRYVDKKGGYRLYFDKYKKIEPIDNLKYNRYQYTVKLQEYIEKNWVTVGEVEWKPYENTRNILDLKVSSNKIFLVINGEDKPFTNVDRTWNSWKTWKSDIQYKKGNRVSRYKKYYICLKSNNNKPKPEDNNQILVSLNSDPVWYKLGTVTDGKYNRIDTLEGGHFGIDRMRWFESPPKIKHTDQNNEKYENVPENFNYVLLRRFLSKEPTFEVYGNADLVITDTPDKGSPSIVGTDVIEIAPDLQQMRETVSGNSLEDYIFATYSIARTEQMIDNYKVTLRNRSTSDSETFTWEIKNSAPDKWKVYYRDDSAQNPSFTLTEPQSTVLPFGSEKTYTLKFIPTISALVNGSSAKLTLSVDASGDGSFDNVSFTTSAFGTLGCFWQYNDKHTVTWPGGKGYDDLADYQVYLSITDKKLLQHARVDGSDIIITDAQNNILDFWLKSYDRAKNSLEAWVKVPNLTKSSDGKGVDLFVWWGNKNYLTSRSSVKKTFDLFEDWESDYAKNDKVGCNDGTSSCQGEAIDPHGWENIPTPDDYYNWWEVDNFGGSKALQADVSSTHHSNDIGPWVHNGGLGWDHYEVSYTFYTGVYNQYHSTSQDKNFANPQYNPVFFNDAGNMWGIEFVKDRFIFRPYASGIDYIYQYQTNVKGLLNNNENFPQINRWYNVKVSVLKDKDATVDPSKRESYLKVHLSQPKTARDKLPDVDSGTGYTLVADFTAPPTFNLDYGGIAFGGWDSGFVFDDIRVRKYVEDDTGKEPIVVRPNVIVKKTITADLMLSSPMVTAPIFNGRPAYIEISATPFAWRGDFFAYYADCYINGECANNKCTVCDVGGTEVCPGVTKDDCEYQDKIGTFSIFGKIDDTTAKGAGFYLMKRDPGENNPSASDPSPRTMFTTDGRNTDLKDFGIAKCSELKQYLGTKGNCVDETVSGNAASYDETEKLIRFVRGYYVADNAFPRSASRNMDMETINSTNYGNSDGNADPKEQWKIADALHSNPLMIGIPNMTYGYKDYWTDFVAGYDKRALYSYFMTNDGVLHAIQLSSVGDNGYYKPDTEATEKWAFIPHAVLPKLKNTIDAEHEYVADGLLRAIDAKIDHNGIPSDDDEWRTILFGLGGRDNTYVFAMDVTEPAAPKLLWEMDSDTAEKIGTTISAPALGKIDTTNDGKLDTWVAIVGSGYNMDYLANYTTSTAWLTVIELATGTILNEIEVSGKIGNVLTDLAVLRDAKSGGINKLYFGDYYGCVWRLDEKNKRRLSMGDYNNGTTSSLNGSCDNPTVPCDLLYKPEDYSNTEFPDAPRYPITAQPRIGKGELKDEFWVYVGTGDFNEWEKERTDPLSKTHKFFGLKDTNTSSDPYILSDLQDMTKTSAKNETPPKSWFIGLGTYQAGDVLNSKTDASRSKKDHTERVIKLAEVYGGFVFFTTFQPLDVTCGGGTSRFYAVDYRTGGLKSGLFLNLKKDGKDLKDIRSVELTTKGVPSQPMIMEGESGKGTAVATGVTTSSSGGIEKVELDPGALGNALDILLWREKR